MKVVFDKVYGKQFFLSSEEAVKALRSTDLYVHKVDIDTIRVSDGQAFFDVLGKGFLFKFADGKFELDNFLSENCPEVLKEFIATINSVYTEMFA